MQSIPPKNASRNSRRKSRAYAENSRRGHERLSSHLERATKVHKGRYDYSQVDTSSVKNFVTIICPEHGPFQQRLFSHLQGYGCKKCGSTKQRQSVSKSANELRSKFIREARKVHGGRYDYGKVSYEGKKARDRVIIIDPELGAFEQTYGNHVTLKHGHPRWFESRELHAVWVERNFGTVEERCADFLQRARKMHGNEYRYPHIQKELGSRGSKITIVCPKCGPITQEIHNHLAGHGCRKCRRSALEKRVARWIEHVLPKGMQIDFNRRDVIEGELDIYIPAKNLALEICGSYWHRDAAVGKRYHARKQRQCADKGITLVTIFDTEWYNDTLRLIIKSSLRARLGLITCKIAARKTSVVTVSGKEARKFLMENHLQGFSPSSVNLGLTCEGELVSLLTLGKPRFSDAYEWEVIRFCSKRKTIVMGAFGKLFKAFVTQHGPSNVLTYTNLRWGTGQTYLSAGFKFVRRSAPATWYVRSDGKGKLYHRVKMQKHRLSKILRKFDPQETASENLRANNYVAVYDCGTNVYEWRRS